MIELKPQPNWLSFVKYASIIRIPSVSIFVCLSTFVVVIGFSLIWFHPSRHIFFYLPNHLLVTSISLTINLFILWLICIPYRISLFSNLVSYPYFILHYNSNSSWILKIRASFWLGKQVNQPYRYLKIHPAIPIFRDIQPLVS